ncbi:unnamed protein product [Spirodela intermedia]|uniref:Uncharacterized protein n=1 Tax=Spirodela intermedia TaxID=51605 RepID=A0A7I8JRG2_SPIIN|nr:unnamed protein product [Spirodela intermedia]CAA6672787.1 unnamed protein product [Spirodela intermedia]
MGRRVVSGGCHPAKRKNGTLRLSGGCHPMERSWMEVVTCLPADRPLSDDGLFLSKQSPFSGVYDHSLPHSRLATGDVEGEWRTCAPIGPSRSSPCSRLLPD